jgi:hypothetical protein
LLGGEITVVRHATKVEHSSREMAQRTVQPDKIKTLRDWVARWPKATNLSFDEETREPTIYSADAARAKVGSIPWRREGDTLTILSVPNKFTESGVAAARRRYARYSDKVVQMRTAGEEQQRIQEQALLEAWQAYNAAAPASRSVMRQDILAAEKAVRDVESIVADQIHKERAIRTMGTKHSPLTGMYTPSMPIRLRGIPMTVIAGEVDDASSPAASAASAASGEA